MHNNVDNSEELTVLSLCSGVRGLDRGVERVTGSLRTVAYVEIEAALIENLVVGMEAGELAPAPIWSNIKTFPWGPFHNKLFFLIGGYPCQPFSSAGKRKGKDDPRHLWPHIERGIRTVRPICCFFENVYGHLSLGFEQVAKSLRSMGYAVEAGVYTASEVGASHKRARVFILAILADAKDHVRGLYERSWKPGSPAPDVAGTGEVAHPARIGEREQVDETDTEPAGMETRQIFGVGSGKELANGIGPGLEESREQPAREECAPTERGGSLVVHSDFCGPQFGDIAGMGRAQESSAWPAGPGEPQFAWEHPRVVESGLGCTVDGYNFREDLLRALGNGVVEEQAELAFRTLLKKHFE
jgi:DNA (cytosine-5)-methyltransferase 1